MSLGATAAAAVRLPVMLPNVTEVLLTGCVVKVMMGVAAKVCVSVKSSTFCAGMVKEKVLVIGVVVRFCPAVTVMFCSVPVKLAVALFRLMVCAPATVAVPVKVTVAMMEVLTGCGLAGLYVTAAVTPFSVMETGGL